MITDIKKIRKALGILLSRDMSSDVESFLREADDLLADAVSTLEEERDAEEGGEEDEDA